MRQRRKFAPAVQARAVRLVREHRSEYPTEWAALLQPICDVDTLACPSGHGMMRIVACITHPSVLDQILTHLRPRAAAPCSAGKVGVHAVLSAECRPTPIEIPIPA
jgi:hypothetical protein